MQRNKKREGAGGLPKVTAIVQARYWAGRLPGKLLLPLAGKPVLAHTLERLGRCRRIDEVVVATTDKPRDDEICRLAREMGVRCGRGSEDDVLGRFVKVAGEVGAEVVVRVCAENPLIDPGVVDHVIGEYFRTGADFATNALELSYPDGMEAEVFPAALLAEIDGREDLTAAHREHVTLYFKEHREEFRLHGVTAPPQLNRPEVRLTLDYEADYTFLRKVFEALPHAGADIHAVLALLDKQPELMKINERYADIPGTGRMLGIE